MTRDEFKKTLARLRRQHQAEPSRMRLLTKEAKEQFQEAFTALVDRYQQEVHYSPDLTLDERARQMVEEDLFTARYGAGVFLGGYPGQMYLLTTGRQGFQEAFRELGRDGDPVPLALIGAVLGEYDRRIAIMHRGRPAPTEQFVITLGEDGQIVSSEVRPVEPPNN